LGAIRISGAQTGASMAPTYSVAITVNLAYPGPDTPEILMLPPAKALLGINTTCRFGWAAKRH